MSALTSVGSNDVNRLEWYIIIISIHSWDKKFAMGFLKVFCIVFLSTGFAAEGKPLRRVIAQIDSLGGVVQNATAVVQNATDAINEMREQCQTENESFQECFQIGMDNLELQKYLMDEIKHVANITQDLSKLEKQIKLKMRLLVKNFILPQISGTITAMMNNIFDKFQNQTCAQKQ
jgi:hypothetical protein